MYTCIRTLNSSCHLLLLHQMSMHARAVIGQVTWVTSNYVKLIAQSFPCFTHCFGAKSRLILLSSALKNNIRKFSSVLCLRNIYFTSVKEHESRHGSIKRRYQTVTQITEVYFRDLDNNLITAFDTFKSCIFCRWPKARC